MQEYAPASRDEAFVQAREYFAETEDWLASGDATGLQHAELEEQLEKRGRELTRRLLQGHLDLLAAGEQRRRDVAGEDGVVRTRAERGRQRPLVTKFGQVSVSRIAYRSPGRPNVHPADAALNLPEEKYSHGLRKLAAIEAVRGSVEDARAAITRAAGVSIGKRQLEEMIRRAAVHVDAFYLHRVALPAPDDHALILTFDGKGIVMLPERCGPPPRKLLRRRGTSSPPGCHQGRNTAASGWPSWPASMTRSPSRARRKTSSPPPRSSGRRTKRRPRVRESRGSRRRGESG